VTLRRAKYRARSVPAKKKTGSIEPVKRPFCIR
jgi:hypothetical protein